MFLVKFYIAAEFAKIKEVKELHRQLKRMGHKIAYDWTSHKNIQPYAANSLLATRYSEQDIQGVINCDVFGLIGGYGTGSHTELGVALATRKVTGKPMIYVINNNDECMMYYHPLVSFVEKKEFLEIAKNMP